MSPPATRLGRRAADPRRSVARPLSEYPTSQTGPSGTPGRRRAELAERRVVRRAMEIGTLVWPAFALLDAFLWRYVFPGGSLAWVLSVRGIGSLLLLAMWATARADRLSLDLLHRLNVGITALGSVMIALMAIELGGFASPYLHGISLIVFVQSTTNAGHWKRALLFTLPSCVAYPLVLFFASAFEPRLAAQVDSFDAMAWFVTQYTFVLAAAGLSAISGHEIWAARRQVYEARKLGRYRLKAPVATGGMSEVWLAWDPSLKRDVVLKILRASESTDDRAIARFEREARAMSQLVSPHTIRIFDFGASDDGLYYIAMEFLLGADLRTLLRTSGPMHPARVVHFGVQACRSLTEAHEAGIIHRDIKPANLFATRSSDDPHLLKVLDFGIARWVDGERDHARTQVGATLGTPTYMAPELFIGQPADARSDLYSLGATLYHLLAGTPPFLADDDAGLMAAHRSDPPLPPSLRRGEGLPSELEAVVLRCLAKDPEDRFPSARALAEALERSFGGAPWTPADARDWWDRAHLERISRDSLDPMLPTKS